MILQSTDEFIDSINIIEPRQKEIAITIRAVIAQQIGLSCDRVVSSMEPNKMLKIATKEWDDDDFIMDIEEKLGVDYVLPIVDQLPSLFTAKFFGFILKQGVKTIGEWVNITSLLCLKNCSCTVAGIKN
jgi:hypothetical protein